MKIAIIAPYKKHDYLVTTVIDGLLSMMKTSDSLEFRITEDYPCSFDISKYELSDKNLIDYAKNSDLIILSTDPYTDKTEIMKNINCPGKSVFIDGSEFKHNNRLNLEVQKDVLAGTYNNLGKINSYALKHCKLYFRREKPYIDGIIPFPYGIESRYIAYDPSVKKDIDFVCIFGQEEYSPMRKYCIEMLENFCAKNGFSCVTSKTKGFDFSENKTAGRDEFYKLLARAKVGISISGGGYDTARFWETLANNCLLLTERIDILEPDDTSLNYERIWQFNNLYDFRYQLEKMAKYLKEDYKQENLEAEYRDILERHSSKARVEKILLESVKAGILKKNEN